MRTILRDRPLTNPQETFEFYMAVVVPKPDLSDEAAALVAFLRGRGWVKAVRLLKAKPPGVVLPPGTEDAKRKLRLLAAAAPDRLLAYPGSRGYCVLQEASMVELDDGMISHRRQSRRHMVRWLAIMREKKQRLAQVGESAAVADV